MRLSQRSWDWCVTLILAAWLTGLIARAAGWCAVPGWLLVLWPTIAFVAVIAGMWLFSLLLLLLSMALELWANILARRQRARGTRYALREGHQDH